jgi:integrase
MASVQRTRTNQGEPRWVVRWRASGKAKERWFDRARDADQFRRQIEAAELKGEEVDPSRGAVRFDEFAEKWLASRRRADGRPLAPRTKELYRYLLDRYLLPEFGGSQLSAVRPGHVRTWHSQVSEASSALQAAKAYRLLRSIFATALEDGRVTSNPCRIRGAGVEHSQERPFVDAEVVLRLADAIEPRYRALVLLAGFGGLRLGELLALTPSDIDTPRRVISVKAQAVDLIDGTRLVTPPKTDAGRRCVHLPMVVMEALERHLDEFPPTTARSPLFRGPLSGNLRRATLQKAWTKARIEAGYPDIHLHDLRHAAGTLAAQTGATTRELMARLGHASPAAAHRYQHAAERRDADIAAALDAALDSLSHGPRPRSSADV